MLFGNRLNYTYIYYYISNDSNRFRQESNKFYLRNGPFIDKVKCYFYILTCCCRYITKLNVPGDRAILYCQHSLTGSRLHSSQSIAN